MKRCQPEKVLALLLPGGTFRLAYADEAAGAGLPNGDWMHGARGLPHPLESLDTV